jgi:tetratricopeptide (TPR) repeat protein
MGRSAGLKAFFVEVEDFEAFYRVEGTVVRSTHVVGGVIIDGRMRTVDFLPDRDKRYRRLAIIGDARAAAHYYNAVGAEAMLAGDHDLAERHFAQALAIDPSFPDAWNNTAVLRRRTDRLDEAIAALEKALTIDRHFLPAMENLSGYYRLASQPELAARMDARALQEKTRNPFFLNQQALLKLQRGELENAENLLRRSRRLDNKIPETFLMLGRVELARGDKEKAESLFAKAQRLSEDYSDAFQNGLNAKIQTLLTASR